MSQPSLRSRLLANRRVLATAQVARDAVVRITTPTPELREWRRIDGDRRLRLEYDLDAESVVFDVGGFAGQWASDIVAMYGCRVEVFEPVPDYAADIEHRFARNPLVTVHASGLASESGTVTLELSGDASSHARAGSGDATLTVALESVEEAMDAMPDGRVDLMKINIEGAEYDLVDHLISSGLIARIRELQVQFHLFVPDARPRLDALRRGLTATHEPTYQYDFLWENWRRR